MFGGLELAIPLIPLIIWMYLKVKQGKLINNAVKELEESGQIYFGQDIPDKAKVMVLVAANRKGEIIDARGILLLRFFKPAQLFDMEEIIGKKIDELAPSKITDEIELRDALKNLKRNYFNLMSEKPRIRKKVKSKRAIKRNKSAR